MRYLSLLVFLVTSQVFAQTKTFDWQVWQQILSTQLSHCKNDYGSSLVNYSLLKNDPRIKQIDKALQSYNPDWLDAEQKKAFYINAYNFFAVKMVLDHYPLQSIRDVGNLFFQVWDKKAGQINHQKITLNQIEHEILRPMGDPRIHFAIVCASMSCPNLRSEVYTAKKLSQQLAQQSRTFLQNTSKGVKIDNKQMHVSAIFKWFAEDFSKDSNQQEELQIQQFIKQYLSLALSKIKTSLDYMDYDWDLNDVSKCQ